MNAAVNQTAESTQTTLGARHYALLRRYWAAGRSGLSSMGSNEALDLAAHGLLAMDDRPHYGLILYITQKGIEALQARVNANRAARSPHHELGDQLAQWLTEKGRACWTNVEFTAQIEGRTHLVRPDVFSIVHTTDDRRIEPAVHEVKVSRSDFLAEMANPDKQAAYAQLSQRLFYVAPKGLIRPEELPAHAGLLERDDSGFSLTKRARKRPCQLHPSTLLRLALKPRFSPEEADLN